MKTPKQLRSDIQTLSTHLSQVQAGLHDRCLRLNHGVLFKLGRS